VIVGIVASVVVLAAAGCGRAPSSAPPSSSPATTTTFPATTTTTTATTEAAVATTDPAPPPTTHAPPPTTHAPRPTTHPAAAAHPKPATTVGPVTAPAAPVLPASAVGGPGTFKPDGSGPLDGKIVTVDPGHNGGNFRDPSYIDRIIFNGREPEACDTTGTETDAGYTEAQFTWNVARDLTADLRAEGATVVLTRTSNTGVGPCVTERAAIGNKAHSNAAVSIHGDGGPPGGRGFTILEPVADGPNNAIIAPSRILGADLRQAFETGTGEPVSDYYGVDGIEPRDDLGGTNLSTVPKVFVECANMRNATDAALVTNPAWQARAAAAIAAGLTTFLHHS
jgi:N-acetylmuramoyl-L-alanine amidase